MPTGDRFGDGWHGAYVDIPAAGLSEAGKTSFTSGSAESATFSIGGASAPVAPTSAPTLAPTASPTNAPTSTPTPVAAACVDVQVKTTTKSYGNENSWDIDGTITNDHAFAANQQYTQTVCLSPGVHTLHMKDS